MERKLTNTTPGATFIGPKLKKLTGKIATKVCKVLSGGNVEVVTDGLENIPDPDTVFVRLVAFCKRLTYILRRRERKFM